MIISAIIIGIIFSIIIINFILKTKHPIRNTISNSLIGIITLFLVNAITPLTSVEMPISLLSLGISSIAGIPGVTLLVALNLL